MTDGGVPITEVTITYPRDPRLFVRDHKTFLRESLRNAAVYHHQEHIPRHFEHSAARRYGYAARTSRINRTLGYQELKDRLGLPPLVSPTDHSGKTKHWVTTIRRVTATSKRSRLFLTLPFATSGRFRGVNAGTAKQRSARAQALMRVAELEAISRPEVNTLTREIERDYTRRANEPGVEYKVKNRPSKN